MTTLKHQRSNRPGQSASDEGGPLILIVDDEPSICWALERSFRSLGFRTVAAASAELGLEIAARQRPELVFLDVRLPKRDGIDALADFLAATDGAPVVVMTAFGDLDTAVAAVKHGASDYLTKPFKLEDAATLAKRNVAAARNRAGRSHKREQRAAVEPRIVGTSAAIQQVFRQIALVAGSNLSVLITGETGTGKELVAEAIHRHSERGDQPYIPIAPVALNEDLIESELFGHVKGAFTGANEDRAGLFRQAEGGTILLDEIGELPMGLQAKLLRVLEQGEFYRVGEAIPQRCDVRILAATNCDLLRAVSEGQFREDLYWRLNGMHIHLPPLRARTEDIGPLCSYFLQRLGHPYVELHETLLEQLAERPWHGNVRELKNAIGHAAVMASGRPIEIGDFPAAHSRQSSNESQSLQHMVAQWAQQQLADSGGETKELYSQFLSATEPILFKLAVEHTAGNRVRAAELLGIHRGTLRDKMRHHEQADAPSDRNP